MCLVRCTLAVSMRTIMGDLLLISCCVTAALATEPPNEELLDEKPHGRNEALISGAMWRHITAQALYQVNVIKFSTPGYKISSLAASACTLHSRQQPKTAMPLESRAGSQLLYPV